MSKKIMLILCDGMRADSLAACGHPFIPRFLSQSFYSLDAQTVLPSMTLPCHLSLMHSVPPERHGTTDNTYKPMVRPVPGIFDQLHRYDRRGAFIYNWEQLRDLSRPGALAFSYYISCDDNDRFAAHQNILDTALSYLPRLDPDFAFVYFGLPDLEGHDFGWMGKAYLDSIKSSWDMIEKLDETFGKDYTIIVTADHGGIGRDHGGPTPEEMTIPIICKGPDFKAGETFHNASIMDIAPTITRLLSVPAAKEWEGKPLI